MKYRPVRRTGRWTLLLASCLLTACISHEPRQLVPSISLSPENVTLTDNADTQRSAGVDFGLVGGINESDSLTNISVLPGIRVRSVVPGGAADRAGIRPGDVILSVDGDDSNHPDVLDALATATTQNRNFEFEVRRNTTVFLATLNVTPVAADRVAPVELYRADPVLLRAGFSTELLQSEQGQRISGARVIRVFDESPLPAAGLRSNDIVLAVDDRLVESAQGLVNTINQYQPGDPVTLSYSRNNEVYTQRVNLWHPGRRLSQLRLWPLFSYESTLDPEYTSLKVGDLILFSLFSYQRRGPEQEYTVLSLFRTATDYGELVED